MTSCIDAEHRRDSHLPLSRLEVQCRFAARIPDCEGDGRRDLQLVGTPGYRPDEIVVLRFDLAVESHRGRILTTADLPRIRESYGEFRISDLSVIGTGDTKGPNPAGVRHGKVQRC